MTTSGEKTLLRLAGPLSGLACLLLACGQPSRRPHQLSPEAAAVAPAVANSEPESWGEAALSSEPIVTNEEVTQCLPPDDSPLTFQLLATARRTPVYARPDLGAERLGYLRAGQLVTRGAAPIKGEGCPRGFYPIEPRGYVCVGVEASLNLEHSARQVNLGQPNLSATLPYTYGISRYPTPPMYTRVPTAAEQSRVEPNIERYLPRRDMSQWLALGLDEVPEFLADHGASFHTSGIRKGRKTLNEGVAFVESGFAFTRRFTAEGRYFGLTTDLEVLPLDRLDWVKPSAFAGVELGSDLQLPLAFVREPGAVLLTGQPDVALRPGRALAYRQAVALTGVRHTYGGKTYWQTKDGDWLHHTAKVTVIEPRKSYPQWAHPERTWIDVSLIQQTLIAYEGNIAKYVTLVSTGRDGTRDAATSLATLQGQFAIHTKHLTATMNGTGEDGAFDLRDVPYVQYFSGGYALHAAYWHDGFGQPKSHGCINLSPLDAKWLFGFTEPRLPDDWHSVLSEDGTWVTIHP